MTVLDERAGDLEREIAELRRQLAERDAKLSHRERDLAEALGRETATAEVLQVINSSPGDLTPVFDAILDKAQRVCGVEHAALELFDGERMHAAAVHGASNRFEETLRGGYKAMDHPAARALLEGERIAHIVDATQINHVAFRTAAENDGVRTVLFVPLRRDHELLGMIASARREVRPFTDEQIALLQSFATQAVIAMENARLITETREALEQQTATAEVLGVINSSPGDLAPVFDAILEKAHTLCGVTHGGLVTYDGEHFRLVAERGMPTALAELVRQPFPARGARQRLVDGAAFVHVADVTAREPADLNDPIPRASDEAGFRTLLMVPLRKDNKLLGYITTHRMEVQPFSDKQIALLQNFAAQAVIAMENARLITETHEALEQQTATAEVLQVINSSPSDLGPVFEAMLERATRLCEASSGLMWTTIGERFQAVAIRGMSTEFVEFIHDPDNQPRMVASNLPIGRVVRGEPLVHVLDLMAGEVTHEPPEVRKLVELGGFRTILALPLRNDAALLGIFVVGRREVRPFTERQIALLQNFAAQAVIAMENARLLGELRQRTDEVAELNRGLEVRVAEQVEELGRVGRLKRFLAPQLAELIVSQGDERVLESHRREIVVVFCDLRGFTAFAETAEPEEVLDLLREYHAALGPLVSQFEGTLDHFSGDGIMVFFNDPVPYADPAERAVKMSMAMRAAAGKLIAAWRRRDRDLGFGVGIAQGYATLGQIGFADRSDYTATGTVCNLAARLCAEAKDGQILLSGRVAAAVEETVALEELGSMALKGITQPVSIFNVLEQQTGTASAEVIQLQRPGQQPA